MKLIRYVYIGLFLKVLLQFDDVEKVLLQLFYMCLIQCKQNSFLQSVSKILQRDNKTLFKEIDCL